MNWRKLSPTTYSFLMLTLGALIEAASVVVFYAPLNIAPAGVSGIAVILNKLIGSPIGLVILLANIPIQVIGYRVLGGSKFVVATVYAVFLYSVSIEIFTPILVKEALSDDALLNALFGGIVGGVGFGFTMMGGGTTGGTSTLARVLQVKYGFPLTSAYLYTDMGVMALAGIVFGWEAALLAIVALFVGATAADYVLEGPSLIRTMTVITDHPKEVADAIIKGLHRGVTAWQGQGMYTGEMRHILFVTVTRTQINTARQLVQSVDPEAFIVIEHGHIAYGEGFKQVTSEV